MADAILKCCKRCGELKPIDQFPLCRGAPRARCKPCHTADATAWAKANHEKYKARLSKWHRDNKPPRVFGPPMPEHIRKARALASGAKWRETNREQFREIRRRWAELNKHVSMEVVRRRQANKIRATPAWANHKAMQEFYRRARRLSEEIGSAHDVDHIVPLQGKTVCGLHCEANLQVLPRTENRRKHNSRWPDMW
jgi:hypothetical protein